MQDYRVFAYRKVLNNVLTGQCVGQVRKRATDPSILEPAEIAAILKELEEVEPVRTAFSFIAAQWVRTFPPYSEDYTEIAISFCMVGKRMPWAYALASEMLRPWWVPGWTVSLTLGLWRDLSLSRSRRGPRFVSQLLGRQMALKSSIYYVMKRSTTNQSVGSLPDSHAR